jgi:hypothetical protein
VVARATRLHAQGEIEGAARTQEQGGVFGVHARAVAGQEQVGAQGLAVWRQNSARPGEPASSPISSSTVTL